MAIKIGTIDVSGVAVGETLVDFVAVGSDIVWQRVTANPLCFTGTATDSVRMTKVGNPNAANIEYSKDGSTWTAYTFGTWIDFDGTDHKVYFRAASDNNISFNSDASNYYKFELDENSPTTISGNINTLFKKDGSIGVEGKTRCFRDFFNGCNIVDASQLELPSTTLALQCYWGMFQNCTQLSAAPALPATTLASSCYRGMFRGCTSLTEVPELPITSLTDYCYAQMFYGCTSLTDAPELPATTLASNCYYAMFSGCSSLSSITVGFSDWQAASSPTASWVDGVAASGEFFCTSALTQTFGASNIPTGWTVVTEGYTLVKYTGTSGLPDWKGDIVGSIRGGDGTPTTQIPNVIQAKEIVIGSNVTGLGDAAFYSIQNLSSMTIGNGVTSIGAQTLAYCGALTSITIPANVTSIDYGAFGNCNGLTSVTFEGFTKNEVKAMTTGSQKIFGENFIDESTGEPMEKSFTAVCSDGSMTIHFSADYSATITFTDL